MLREDQFVRVVDVMNGQTVVLENGGQQMFTTLREMFWHPRGYWKRFDPDSNHNQRRTAMQRAMKSPHTAVSGYTINDAWDTNFLLASSSFVTDENQRYRDTALNTDGWAPVTDTPCVPINNTGLLLEEKQVGPRTPSKTSRLHSPASHVSVADWQRNTASSPIQSHEHEQQEQHTRGYMSIDAVMYCTDVNKAIRR